MQNKIKGGADHNEGSHIMERREEHRTGKRLIKALSSSSGHMTCRNSIRQVTCALFLSQRAQSSTFSPENLQAPCANIFTRHDLCRTENQSLIVEGQKAGYGLRWWHGRHRNVTLRKRSYARSWASRRFKL
jgi:hypothetical protein